MRFLLMLFFTLFISINWSQSSQIGGFVYGWDSYTDDELTGLGSRVVDWDSTDMVEVVHAPEIGVHPRVYFGPSEVPDILERLETTASGSEAKATMHAYTTLLHLGVSYNQTEPYALDPDGNRYISNSGAWNMAPYYAALKAHDATVWDDVPVKIKHRTAALMSLEAFMCYFYPADFDADVSLDYATRAADLADAMHFWATLSDGDPTVNPTGQNFNNFGGTHMALCYDLMYDVLAEEQRALIRSVLNQIIPDHPRHGWDLVAYANTSNWSTLNSFEIIINLAMEGESGYKPELTEEWMRALHTFINYGWYPSGAGYEGLGKNYQFVTTLIVCAKRGYSLLPHPHVRAYGENFLVGIMQPFGNGFTSYDVWGGSGYDPQNGQYKFNSADAVGLKWAFPNSEKIDFVWRNYINGFYQNDSRGYVYAQVYPDDSYNNYLIPAAVFAQNYESTGWQTQANNVVQKNYIAMDRGLATFKSSTDTNAIALQFHARQDMGGHTHGDRNDFTLSGLGRIWIRKSYGGSQFQTSKHHSMILVDDLGMPVGDPDGDKCRQPATVLGSFISDDLSTISGDATYAYSWDWHWSPQAEGSDHPWSGSDGWEPVMESWNDFLVTPNPESHYDIPFYNYPHWHIANRYERMVKRSYNPMQKVVRNVGLLRGLHPMALIIDDIQKDEEVHNYKWIAQIARDLELDYYDVNLENLDYRCDIVLKEPADAGDRRLLVRVLNNENYDGASDPGYIDSVDYVDFFSGEIFTPNPNWERPRLIVESNSIAPNFKVMIYPFIAGEELPTTNWNETKDTLAILFEDEERKLRFYKDELENTQFELVVDIDDASIEEKELFTFSVFPNPSEGTVTVRSKDIIEKVRLIDVVGKQVLIQEVTSTNLVTLELSSFKAGTYYIQIENSKGEIQTKKLILK